MKKVALALGLLLLLTAPAFAQSTISGLQNGGLVQTTDWFGAWRPGCTHGGDCRVQFGALAAVGAGPDFIVNGGNLFLNLGNKTGALQLPVGTTAQRPSSPGLGMVRYNSDVSQLEAYVAGAWGPLGSGSGSISLTSTGPGIVLGSSPWTGGANTIALGTPTTSTLGGLLALASPTSHQVVQYVDTSGVQHLTQLTASDISGLAASATVDTTNASNIGSGTLPAARLPAPTTSSFGGILALASATSHQIVQYIDTSGVQHLIQLAFSDLSGTLTNSQLPTSGVTAGSYTNLNATINAQGIVTVAANGSSASTTRVTKRPPLPTDDSTVAYSTGQFWNYGGSIYQSQYVGTGQANWAVQFPLSAPTVDLVPGAVGAYGVYKLRNAYAGNAFAVTRTSDSTTLAIGFDVNGIANWPAVDIFCKGTNCGVSTWYDQSGNGYDLTQATAANQPQIFGDYVAGMRAISFNGGTTGNQQGLINNSIPITDLRNFSALFVGRQTDALYPTTIYQAGTGGTRFFLYNETGNNWPTSGLIALTTPNTGIASGFSFTTPEALLTIANAGAVTLIQNDQVQTTSGTDFTSTTAVTGLSLGLPTVSSTAYGQMDALAFIIYSSSLSSANQQLLLQSTYQTTGIQPQVRDQLVMMGSSILNGTGGGASSTPQGMFAGQLVTAFERPMNFINLGISGVKAQYLSTIAAGVAARAYRPGANNYLVIDVVGSNDISTSTSVTASQVCGYYQTIGAAFKAAGFQKVAMSTITPRAGLLSGGQTAGGFDTTRLAFNSLLLGGCAASADAIVDPGGDPTIGPAASLSNGALWLGDQTHLTVPLGSSYMAAAWVRGLQSLLQ